MLATSSAPCAAATRSGRTTTSPGWAHEHYTGRLRRRRRPGRPAALALVRLEVGDVIDPALPALHVGLRDARARRSVEAASEPSSAAGQDRRAQPRLAGQGAVDPRRRLGPQGRHPGGDRRPRRGLSPWSRASSTAYDDMTREHGRRAGDAGDVVQPRGRRLHAVPGLAHHDHRPQADEPGCWCSRRPPCCRPPAGGRWRSTAATPRRCVLPRLPDPGAGDDERDQRPRRRAVLARAEVMEAYVLGRLGEYRLAEARMWAATSRFPLRPELPEVLLAKLGSLGCGVRPGRAVRQGPAEPAGGRRRGDPQGPLGLVAHRAGPAGDRRRARVRPAPGRRRAGRRWPGRPPSGSGVSGRAGSSRCATG